MGIVGIQDSLSAGGYGDFHAPSVVARKKSKNAIAADHDLLHYLAVDLSGLDAIHHRLIEARETEPRKDPATHDHLDLLGGNLLGSNHFHDRIVARVRIRGIAHCISIHRDLPGVAGIHYVVVVTRVDLAILVVGVERRRHLGVVAHHLVTTRITLTRE